MILNSEIWHHKDEHVTGDIQVTEARNSHKWSHNVCQHDMCITMLWNLRHWFRRPHSLYLANPNEFWIYCDFILLRLPDASETWDVKRRPAVPGTLPHQAQCTASHGKNTSKLVRPLRDSLPDVMGSSFSNRVVCVSQDSIGGSICSDTRWTLMALSTRTKQRWRGIVCHSWLMK